MRLQKQNVRQKERFIEKRDVILYNNGNFRVLLRTMFNPIQENICLTDRVIKKAREKK